MKLALDATDPAPASGVASMRFKNAGTTKWSAWQTYATAKSWMLTAGAGTKTVYVQYRDKAGNVSAHACAWSGGTTRRGGEPCVNWPRPWAWSRRS